MIDVPLYFLGKRDYVNGLTIFEEMIETFIDAIGSSLNELKSIRSFKIASFVRHDCGLEIWKEGSSSSRNVKNAVARMNVATKDANYILLLFEYEDHQVTERYRDYDRSRYIQAESDKSGESFRVTLENVHDVFTLMRGIVEADFRYCNEQASKANIPGYASWAYLTDFYCPREENYVDLGEIQFVHKSTIRSSGKIFMMSEIYNNTFQKDQCAEICFFFNEPK